MHRASAVILSFRRIGNLPQILGSLLGLEWVEDIIVWHNARTLLKRWQLGGVAEASERVSIINCPENKYTWGRFLACRACENRRILIQDDDVLVMNWAEIAEAWEPESIAAGMQRATSRKIGGITGARPTKFYSAGVRSSMRGWSIASSNRTSRSTGTMKF